MCDIARGPGVVRLRALTPQHRRRERSTSTHLASQPLGAGRLRIPRFLVIVDRRLRVSKVDMLYDMAGLPRFVCLKLRYESLSTSLDELQRYSLQQIRRSQRIASVRLEGAVSDPMW